MEGSGSPSNTVSPGQRPTSLPSGILVHPAVSPQQTWADNFGRGCAFVGGGAGSNLTECVAMAGAYLHAKFHLDPSNRLDTIHQRHRQTDKPVAFYGPIAPQFRMSPVRNAPELRSLHAATPPVQSEYPAEHRAAAAVPLPESP